ncbi:MAG: biopolymer transporter ExbD [bacterium]
MKRNIYQSAAYTEINITPLMDLAWNLLVVFIVAITATVQGIKVNLPKASSTPSMAKPKTKAISITAEGRIYLDTFPVTIADLESRLRQYKAADPDLPVIIKGDEKIAYKQVVEVLDLLARLEINQLGLVTQKLVK